MMISTKGRYALRVMAALATDSSGAMVPLKDIAHRQEISEKYLEAIIKELVRANLVIGVRGKGGGYRLAKRPEEYTVKEILEAAEGSLAPVACMEIEGDRKPCPRAGKCITLPIWQGLDRLIQDYFSGITLAQLIEQVNGQGASAADI